MIFQWTAVLHSKSLTQTLTPSDSTVITWPTRTTAGEKVGRRRRKMQESQSSEGGSMMPILSTLGYAPSISLDSGWP